MKLSPLDLRKQQFRTTFRGYDPDEVRGFIDKLASDWEEVLEEHRQAEARVAEMQHKMQHYERVEMALQEALEAARETAKRAEESAKHKAKMIVEEAELRAHQITQDAERERYNLRQDLVKLNARQTEISARLRAFLMSEMEVLAQFQGDDPIGFIKLMSADEHRTPALPPAAAPAPAETPTPSSVASPTESTAVPPREAPISAPEASAPSPKPASPAPEPSAADPAPARTAAPPAPPVAPGPTPEAAPPAASGSVADSTPTPSGPAPAEPPTAPEKPASESQAPASAEEETALPTYRDVLSAANQSDPEATPAPSVFSSRFFQPKEAGGPVKPEAAAPTPHEEPASGAEPNNEKQGWSLRSLVTGKAEKEKSSVVASDDERERIRRILEDLD
ncbi:MAG: DivIVA domain-containing protein [Rhodothermaceae bacterium]|nr:DivIVA domain-containing protein [Rhodothermaceae bacterium]